MKIKIILLTLLLNAYVVFNSYNQQVPLVYSIENTGADCPEPPLPSFEELPLIDPLPDPFEWSDGSGYINSIDDWRCRRVEIGAEIQQYELGTKPPHPDTLEIKFIDDTMLIYPPFFPGGDTITVSCALIKVTIIVNSDTLMLDVPVSLPNGQGPFPAVIGVGSPFPGMISSLPSDIFTSRGIATINFIESQITNAWSNIRGDGPFFELYPDKTRSKFIAWAWGVSRIIDALEICPEANIDLSHLAITGCSYAGKIALFSGAYDERIALTISQESGGGGFTAWRVTETLSGSRETLRNAQGQAWYYSGVSQFNNAVNRLPYDHHELMAMIAPRSLFVTGNPSYEWLADESGHVASKAAHEVWKFLGVPDRFGFSILSGHDHCVVPNSQIPEIEAFVDKFLLGDTTANTDISTSPYNSDIDHWIEWWGTGEPPIYRDTSTTKPERISETMNDRIDLMQNYPNPFDQTTTIEYSVQKPSQVELKIYNSLGQLTKTLVDNFKTNGEYAVNWDGKDNSGNNVPLGNYFYRIKIGDYTSVKTMIYFK
ncbi:MAG: T9SS type A sorting domain-containing protein [Bacteroidales bacterium]|nr:T9SS type A sorting domain-containing protein [Bacteroidales bacterium]